MFLAADPGEVGGARAGRFFARKGQCLRGARPSEPPRYAPASQGLASYGGLALAAVAFVGTQVCLKFTPRWLLSYSGLFEVAIRRKSPVLMLDWQA